MVRLAPRVDTILSKYLASTSTSKGDLAVAATQAPASASASAAAPEHRISAFNVDLEYTQNGSRARGRA
ncbi:hypothetical protein N7454_001374 [Penicillium verhagenii]|nr:hypothetical protein N7454_001374 [Penicillium verhagenii]